MFNFEFWYVGSVRDYFGLAAVRGIFNVVRLYRNLFGIVEWLSFDTSVSFGGFVGIEGTFNILLVVL